MKQAQQITLAALFLGIIWTVPITQSIIEVADGETPQIIEMVIGMFDLDEDTTLEEHLRSFESDIEEYSFFEENLRPLFQLVRYFATKDMGAKALRGNVAPDGQRWYFFQPGINYLTEAYFRDIESLDKASGGTVISGGGMAKQAGDDPVAVIRDFADQMQARGIKLLVVPVPGKASIYPDRLTSTVEAGTPVYAHTSRFIKELKDKGVEVVNIHEVLVKNRPAADARGESLYMASDTHWSGAGVNLAAKAIADRIKQEDWYKELVLGQRYYREKIPVGRRGDIPEMTQLPLQEDLFTTEKVDCYQVLDKETHALYEDAPASPVLLLGDSFSRVFQTDDPQAAGLIANLAYELQLPLASIVNNGGASTAVRQKLARKIDLLEGKRLIIWEFVERDIRFGMQGWQRISFSDD
jgi:acetyltransferase AlgX (SGNH hydrolase-like protein)